MCYFTSWLLPGSLLLMSYVQIPWEAYGDAHGSEVDLSTPNFLQTAFFFPWIQEQLLGKSTETQIHIPVPMWTWCVTLGK
jgi:hypothetical protein